MTIPSPADDTMGAGGGYQPLEPEHFTDLGNARRLVAAHGRDLRYVPKWGAWLVWDTVRWAQDETGVVERRAKETVAAMYAEASYSPDDGYRQRLARHAMKSESEHALRAMVSVARSEPGIPVTPDQLDADPMLLNCVNATLDLRTGELQPHRREDLITKLVPAVYDPAATCPTWTAFLDRIMAGHVHLVRFLQKMAGYSLTGDTSEQALFLFHGNGANGKTTFVMSIALMLGDYAKSTPIDTFLVKHGDHPRNDLARLHGARFVSAAEADAGRRLAEALVKEITGGEVVTARFLYREQFDFVPTFTLVISTNHKPTVRGSDHALWRRIRLVPFTVTIPDAEQDRALPKKLRAELPGILRWAVEGCLLWQHEGLGVPDEVRAATDAYRGEMDILGGFLEDRCELFAAPALTSKDTRPFEESASLYEAYVSWCREAGEKAISRMAFGQRLTEHGVRSDRVRVEGKQVRVWRGVTRVTGRDTSSRDFSMDSSHGELSRNGVSDASRVTQGDFEAVPDWVRE